MPAILKIPIGHSIETKDILTKTENERFEIFELESLKFECNTKTCRIMQELIKKGYNPVNVKYGEKKKNMKKSMKFMLTKPKNSYKK